MNHQKFRHLLPYSLLLIGGVIWCSGLALRPTNPLEQILEQHIDAMGGKQAWSAITNYRMISKRRDGSSVMLNCLMPDQITIAFNQLDQRIVKGYDGAHGYLIQQDRYEPMRPGEAIEMAEEPRYYSELMFARDSGYLLTYEGKEEIFGISCFKINMVKSATDEHVYWINSESYLIEQTGEYSEDPAHHGIYYKTRLLNYREIDGCLFPFEQWLIANDGPPRKSNLTSCEINVDLATDHFTYEPSSTRNLIAYWKDRYAPNQPLAFTFDQETIEFDSMGNATDTSMWYEAVQYPNLFRIDFQRKPCTNTNLYRNDSVYIIRNDSLRHAGRRIQPFMILEGGLYTNPIDSTLSHLTQIGIDTAKFHAWENAGSKNYVIGVNAHTLNEPQIWLDVETRNSTRRITRNKAGKLFEVRYEDFRNIGGHSIEQWLEFYLDGQLIQTEEYRNVVIWPHLDEKIFHPNYCTQTYWY